LGKIPTTSVRRLTSRLSRSSGLVDQILRPVRVREVGEGGQVGLGLAQQLGDGRELPLEGVGDDFDLLADGVGGRLGEHGPDGRGDHLGVALVDLGQRVAHEVHPAALPGGALQHGLDGVGQAAVAVADDQLHPAESAGQAAVAQGAQELRPERLGLAVTDRAAEHLPVAVGGDAGGDDDGR
jgi:hypothetical protein